MIAQDRGADFSLYEGALSVRAWPVMDILKN